MQVKGTTPLWVAARVLLYERGDDFFRRRDGVLKTFDAEDIHDLRVSSRRLREGLALFAPCYSPRNIARLVKRVRGVTRLLGEIRNSDEAVLFFSSLRDELGDGCRGDLDRLITSFQKERKKELGKLESGLREIAGNDFRDLYLRLINSPALFAPVVEDFDLFVPLGYFAKESLSARLADVLKLVPEARQAENADAQHLLRIAVKHFRYRMEIFSFLLGSGYEGLHSTVKVYQEVLGKMHDLHVFAGISREAGFAPQTTESVLEAIVAQGDGLFAGFSGMLETMPFEMIGERVRDAL